jgi:Mor family transcriptional regulator
MAIKKENIHNSETISLNSLPEILQMIAETLSIEAAVKLSQNFGGMRIYIPKIEGLLRSNRDEQIRKEFNGANHIPLARKYKLSESQIRTIVQKRSKLSK